MKTIKIFLASSETLKQFRDQITIKIAGKNKLWNEKGINLELVIWEDLTASMQLTRSQNSYNQQIHKCQLFVLLASGRIGKFTKEEFTVAHRLFANYAKPKIFIYLDKTTTIEDESLTKFKAKLNEIEHFPAYYTSFDNLWDQLNTEIENFLHQIHRNTDTRTHNTTLPKQIGNIPIKPTVFMGREGELSKIYKAFFEDEKPVVMLVGKGGLGKTTIASTYYHHFKDDYSHLIWSMAETGIAKAILSLATALKIQFENNSTLQEQIEQVLQEINVLPEPVLMVIDNVDNYDDFMNNHQYLRKTPNIHILITSRLVNFEDFDKFDIKKLSPEIAKDFFKHYYTKFKPEEEEILDNVLKAVGYNTLVIELFAKNLQQTKIIGYNLEKLLADLQKEGVLGITKTRKITNTYHNIQTAKPQEIVEAMYNFGNLTEDELNILTLFSVLPEINLPVEDILKFSNYDKDILTDLLLNLANKAWLDIDDKQDEYKINTIIASIIRQKRENIIYINCELMINTITDDLKYDTSSGTVPNYKTARKYADYAIVFTEFINEKTYNLSLLFDCLGNFYQFYGNINTALYYYKKKHHLAKELYIKNSEQIKYKKDLSISFERLGSIYELLEKWDIALKYYQEYNRLTKECYLENSDELVFKFSFAISYQNLGEIYRVQEKFNDAYEYYKRFNQLTEELYKENPKQLMFKKTLAISNGRLGSIYEALKEFDKALKYYHKQYRLSRELYFEHPKQLSYKDTFASSNYQLGSIYESLGILDKALEYYHMQNHLSKELNRKDSKQISFIKCLSTSYERLAGVYESLGLLDKALGYYLKHNQLSKELYKKYPKQFKVNLIFSYQKIAFIYKSLGKWNKFLENFIEYLRLTKEQYQDNCNKKGLKKRIICFLLEKFFTKYFFQNNKL